MNSKKNITIALAIVLAFLLGIIFSCYFFQGEKTILDELQTKEDTEESSEKLHLHPNFPSNVIDGHVYSIDKEKGEMRFIALTESMLINPPRASKEVIVNITEETTYVTFDLGTKEEIPASLDDINVSDNLAVETKEDSLELFERDSFTAVRITKRVGNPFDN
ncbi:MAG: hypothetical protein WBK67_03250 [Minisyncoccales bacterium]|jgi:hypothetical protein